MFRNSGKNFGFFLRVLLRERFFLDLVEVLCIIRSLVVFRLSLIIFRCGR